ncbi:MAG: hypothetical protein ABZF75_00440 [Columbia Basin potato purple top phytoplasma]
MIKAQENTYSGAIKPLTTKIKEDVKQRINGAKEKVENVTSWFKSWFLIKIQKLNVLKC